jgi:hypothetical protein
LLHDSEATLAVLFQLREMGARIAMDDFAQAIHRLAISRLSPSIRSKSIARL